MMELRVVIGAKSYRVDLIRPKSLAIPLHFNGQQPNFFAAPRAEAKPLTAGSFVGDTQRGGGCNVAELRLVPHCNGTHTESVGHVVHDKLAVFESVPQSLMPAVVTSVTPVAASETTEVYRSGADSDERLITRTALAAALADYAEEELTALVVRTLPNEVAKKDREYGDTHKPPFFSNDAMNYLVERGVQQLLVDVPSLDKMHDAGTLTNHHIFWNLREGVRNATPDTYMSKTVTEMVFAGDDIVDGLYLLNLQLPAFHTDAAPSRPVLYSLEASS